MFAHENSLSTQFFFQVEKLSYCCGIFLLRGIQVNWEWKPREFFPPEIDTIIVCLHWYSSTIWLSWKYHQQLLVFLTNFLQWKSINHSHSKFMCIILLLIQWRAGNKAWKCCKVRAVLFIFCETESETYQQIEQLPAASGGIWCAHGDSAGPAGRHNVSTLTQSPFCTHEHHSERQISVPAQNGTVKWNFTMGLVRVLQIYYLQQHWEKNVFFSTNYIL